MRPWPSYRRRVQRLPGDPRIAWPALRERGRGPPDEADSSTEVEEEHPRDGVARGLPDRAPGPTSERNPNDKGVGPGFLRGRKDAFSTEICAENLRRAVEFAAKRCPGRAVGLRFPSGPETFIVDTSRLEMETSWLKANEASGQAFWEWAEGGGSCRRPARCLNRTAPVPGRVTK
jgi:hypothetical protein